jgi:pyridoxamine 5'-phosphate oxidase
VKEHYLAPWRSPLARALEYNRSLPYSRYLQLATVGLDGRPRNRTVVFRGFRDHTNQLQIVTDSRSEKVPQINQQSWGEICWYFPKTREQFRFLGQLIIVSSQSQESDLLAIRSLVWQSLSDAARKQFTWAEPKHPLNQTKEAFNPPLPSQNIPVANFCLLLLDPVEVDHLQLRGEPQNRCLYCQESQKWTSLLVNP